MAADYYPTTAPVDFANPMMGNYSRHYAFGAFHPGPLPQQFAPQSMPFVIHSNSLHSAALPFQSPFMFIRPAFVDTLPMNSLPPFQPVSEQRVADIARVNFVENEKNNHLPNSHSHRPQSARFHKQSQEQMTEDTRENAAAKPQSSRKKKKKSKRTDDTSAQGLTAALGDMSVDSESAVKTQSTAQPVAPSYSDAVKRPVPQSPPTGTEQIEESNDATLLNPIVEEFPSLESTQQKTLHRKTLSSKPQHSQRGLLHVPPGLIDENRDTMGPTVTRSSRQLDSFKVNLANLTPGPQNKQKYLKGHSSARTERPASSTISSEHNTSSDAQKSAATPKKPLIIHSEEASPSSDSADRKPKYSKLKKVILEERKKRQQPTVDIDDSDLAVVSTSLNNTGSNLEHDIEQRADSESGKAEVIIQSTAKPSQGTLGSVCNAYLSSALAGLSKEDADAVCRRLHRRRFREYCNQVLGAALDDSAYLLLTTLGGFQQRQYEQNPVKAKLRRRYVCGLREAVKHIQLGKAKCIILAPNIERIPGKGGLDDMIGSIISQCANKNVPVVFALGRVALGRACSKPSPVSSVAIISQAGAEDKFKQTLDLAQRAHESYIELVKMAVSEQIEQREQSSKHSAQPEKMSAQSQSGAHVQFSSSCQLGHSRNASNISAISFISAMSDSSVGGGLNVPSSETAENEDSDSHHNVPFSGVVDASEVANSTDSENAGDDIEDDDVEEAEEHDADFEDDKESIDNINL